MHFQLKEKIQKLNKKRVFWLSFLGLLFVIITSFAVGYAKGCSTVVLHDYKNLYPSDSPTPKTAVENTRFLGTTYLSLPEWHIVYSSEEYGNFIAENPPSKFPYFQTIGQYWCLYKSVNKVINENNYPVADDGHLVIKVIGASQTAEYLIKGIYEKTIGRISEVLGFGFKTNDDIYSATVAKEYASFLYQVPWYEFPFSQKFIGLWREAGLFEFNLIRKIERKIALSLEYGAKTIYGFAIKKATKSALGNDELEMPVWTERLETSLMTEKGITFISKVDSKTDIVSVPRYKKFTDLVIELADKNINLLEIAGHNKIALSVLAPISWQSKTEAKEIISMPILTKPTLKRSILETPVNYLTKLVKDLEKENIHIEHIYDY